MVRTKDRVVENTLVSGSGGTRYVFFDPTNENAAGFKGELDSVARQNDMGRYHLIHSSGVVLRVAVPGTAF